MTEIKFKMLEKTQIENQMNGVRTGQRDMGPGKCGKKQEWKKMDRNGQKWKKDGKNKNRQKRKKWIEATKIEKKNQKTKKNGKKWKIMKEIPVQTYKI